jgi:hypothetical protein
MIYISIDWGDHISNCLKQVYKKEVDFFFQKRLLKNGHLPRFPHSSALRRTRKYVSLLRVSGALHLALFERPAKMALFRKLLKIADLTSKPGQKIVWQRGPGEGDHAFPRTVM